MWTSFIESMTVAILVLYIPGIALLHVSGMKNTYGVVLAPLASVFLLELFGEIFALWHVAVSPSGLWLISTIAALILGGMIQYFLKGEIDFPSIPALASSLYVLAGIIGLLVVYVSAVGGAQEFCQSFDMAHHINTIQSFLDASTYSSLFQSMYMGPSDININPWNGGGFYPSAYHICCALVASMTGVSNAIAINAFNALLCSVVFPLSMLALMGYIFQDEKTFLLVGSLFVVCLPSFPWDYLVYGPLYPNLMGFSIMMLEAVLFMKLCDTSLSLKVRVYVFMLFIIGGISLALVHPSSIFFLAIFLMPFCIDRIICVGFNDKDNKRRVALRIISVIVLLVVWFLFFIGLYQTGIVQKMASFDWGVILKPKEAICAILTCSYMGDFYCSPSAFVFAFFVIVGIIYSFKNRKYLWISGSYLIFCFCVYINSTSDNALKHFIGSFWYTDPLRFASMTGIVGVVLASLGLGMTILIIRKTVKSTIKANWLIGSLVAIVAAFSFLPLNIPGWYGSLFPLGSARENIAMSMEQNLYTNEKMAFVHDVQNIVGDKVVVNIPADGSKFIYGAEGMRTLYRSHGGYDSISNEKRDSRLIRTKLNEYTTNEDVARALDALDVSYVLLLDPNQQFTDLSDEKILLERNKFRGILEIDDTTPGFELVAANGNFKLYKIMGYKE